MSGLRNLLLGSLQRLRHFSQFVKLDNSNYFNVFKFKSEFAIDEERLAKAFKSMQMLYHPDKTARLDQDSKEIAEFNSSLVNHAYQTLKDPYKRGLHLLNLNNLTISEDESTKNLSPDFLLEMMEINEQINEKRKASDELRKMLAEIDRERKRLLELIETSFRGAQYEEAKRYLIKLNFYNNVAEKLVDLID